MVKLIEYYEGTNFRTIPLDETKLVKAHNIRTKDNYQLKFTKTNKYSYKVTLIGNNDYELESSVLTNGRMTILWYGSMHVLFFKEEKLNIILPEEIELSYDVEEE